MEARIGPACSENKTKKKKALKISNLILILFVFCFSSFLCYHSCHEYCHKILSVDKNK